MISYKVTILRTGWKWESIHQGEEVTNDTHCCPLKKKEKKKALHGMLSVFHMGLRHSKWSNIFYFEQCKRVVPDVAHRQT